MKRKEKKNGIAFKHVHHGLSNPKSGIRSFHQTCKHYLFPSTHKLAPMVVFIHPHSATVFISISAALPRLWVNTFLKSIHRCILFILQIIFHYVCISVRKCFPHRCFNDFSHENQNRVYSENLGNFTMLYHFHWLL